MDQVPPEKGPGRPDVPDFDLIRPIGRGGFGEVWLAANRTTGQLHAVKVIPLRAPGAARREIVSLTRLEKNLVRRHPNLIAIHHVGTTAEHLFYVMDLADDVSGAQASAGEGYRPATLGTWIEKGPLERDACLACARQLLSGLASLHEAGMVHRDVKPGNCLFVGGELKLADFGLLAEADSQVSRVGTEKYMPPDGRMDTRGDVYAAGLVIYEMLTGLPADRFPHLGGPKLGRDSRLCGLLGLALRACDPAPEYRFRDASRMLADLEGIEKGTCARRVILRRWVAAAAAASILSMLGVAHFLTTPPRVHVNFTTYPFEATILLDGVEQRGSNGSLLKTPCTIDGLPARQHHVVFRISGLPDLDAKTVDFSATRDIVARWNATEPADPEDR